MTSRNPTACHECKVPFWAGETKRCRPLQNILPSFKKLKQSLETGEAAAEALSQGDSKKAVRKHVKDCSPLEEQRTSSQSSSEQPNKISNHSSPHHAHSEHPAGEQPTVSAASTPSSSPTNRKRRKVSRRPVVTEESSSVGHPLAFESSTHVIAATRISDIRGGKQRVWWENFPF